MDSIESRIEKQSHGKPAEEIQKLVLDNCRSTEIVGLSDDYKNLSCLSLVNVGLTSLKNFPTLPKLKKLDLSDNRIADDLNLLQGSPNLSYLNLSGNLIKDIDALQPLKSLRELQNLDLYNCEVTNTEGYREKVFALLDGLLYLDGFDKDDQEADIDDDSDEEDEEDDHNGEHAEGHDEEEDEEDDVGLAYLDRPDLENESDGEEFAPEEDGPDDLDEEDEDSEEEPSRGVKRKRTDDAEEDEGK